MPGQLVGGRFLIVRFIARGGMGEVYEAEDCFLQGVHVALKTILPQIAGDPDLQDSFKREVLLAREVTHPNLCPIYDIFSCDEPAPGSLFLTMKLLPGANLRTRLKESTPIPPDEAMVILKQMASGLSAIHAAGIVHRDIKSSNVMLDGHGQEMRLWITDFGLARTNDVEATLSNSENIAGTPAYMAPELFVRKPPSRATDLYALGVVMHEVFTGQKPSPSSDGTSVTVSPQLNASSVPAYCSQFVKDCLNADPKQRCQAFKEVLETLHLESSKKAVWTRRRFIGTGAAAACLVAGTASWQWDRLDNLLHPLPRKRFIALLNWPKTTNGETLPMLTGALNAIKAELIRVEAFDRNLFVISPEDVNQDAAAATHLVDICDPLGANLALAIACLADANSFHIYLRLLDPTTNESLRTKKVICPRADITTLPEKAALAAASLLDVKSLLRKKESINPGTQSNEAFTAFQTAETLRKQLNDKGLEAAIDNYKEAIEIDPGYALAYAKLAQAYVRYYYIRRDVAALDLARRNGEKALAFNPTLVDGHLALSSVRLETGDEPGAISEIATVLAEDRSDPKALLWQAQIYTRLNRWTDAESTFDLVLKQRPNSWVTYNELAYALHQQGKYHAAIDKLRTAALVAPKSALVLSNLGSEYLEIGDYVQAVDYLKKSIQLDPDSDETIVNVAQALRCKGAYKEALPYARRAVSLNPADDINWMELGNCYSSLPHQEREAKAAYLRAAAETERHIKVDPKDGPAWLRLAFYHVETGHPKEADQLMQRAESCGAGDMDSQLCKVRILELLGRRNQALALLTHCFQMGASDFQIAPIPGLESLRHDPRYRALAHIA
jgi:serine/threonine protein kinase/Tfp pilus assembly protein PilF